LETIIKLSSLKNIVSIKEASGNMFFDTQIRVALPNFSILSGDDGSFLPFLSIGGDGCISVVSNIAPKLMVDLYENFKKGNIENAMKLNTEVMELTKALFLETNPIPVKTALVELNKISEEFRLPLTKMNELNRRMLRMALRRVKLF
jgi:4-hydroxy-tetrahydrodipicolinate synthase